jgi:hypothetical protein
MPTYLSMHISIASMSCVCRLLLLLLLYRSQFFSYSFYIPARRELKYLRLWLQQYLLLYTQRYIHCMNTAAAAAAAKKPKPPLAVYAFRCLYVYMYTAHISIGYYNIYYYYTLRASRPSRGMWIVRHAARNRIQTPGAYRPTISAFGHVSYFLNRFNIIVIMYRVQRIIVEIPKSV